ncbi:MAG: penicillin-binding protein activator [Pseudomonadota bacterium]
MVSVFERIGNARQWVRGLLFGTGMLALAACEAGPLPGPTFGGASSPVDVALLVPSGSGVGELDQIARSLENAARLAAADLNGVDVNLTVYSTRRDSATAVAAARQAVAEGADVILGPLDGDVAAAVGLAMRGANRSVLTFSNNTAIAGGNVYLLGQTFADSAQRVARYASSQGKSRVLVVHAQTVAGEAGRAAATGAAQAAGMSVVATAPYENTLPGIAAATGRIRSTATTSGADTLFLTSTSAGALPILAELLPEAGLGPDSLQYIGLGRWDLDPRLTSMSGVQGGWFAMPDRARQAAFASRYSSATGSNPHPLAFTAYDGIAIIGALWAQGGANPLGGQALTRQSGFQGSLGPVRLRVNGTNERSLAIGSIQGGQVVTIDAAPQGFGGTGF